MATLIGTTTPALAVVRAGAAALLAAAVLLYAGAAPADAAEQATTGEIEPWRAAPASNSYGPDRPNYDYALSPGQTVQDGLSVSNEGTEPLQLTVYAADAFTTDGGRLDLRTQEHPATGVGGWLDAERNQVSVAPGASVEVPFTITVPDDAVPGDHMGGIVTSLAVTEDGAEVERREAVRVHVRVAGEVQPRLEVDDLTVDYSDALAGRGEAVVTYLLRNTGNATLAAEQTVAVTGPFGSFSASAEPVETSPELLPGETWPVSAPVHDVVPTGLLTATVSAVPLYTDPAGSTGPLSLAEGSAHGWAVPWLTLSLIAVAAVVAVIAWRRRPATGTDVSRE